MTEQNELDGLYREAKNALKAKEYDRAVGLLTQVLVIDEGYKDVSRLLAQSVRLKRRRWYSHPATWGTLGALLLLGLGFFLAPKISNFYAAQPAAQVVTVTTTPSPITNATATATLLPTPTPIPLTWKRLNIGQEFARDTITDIAIDPKDQDVLYAGMKNAGVYKSIDGGLSWRPAHQGLSNAHVKSLLIDSQNPRILYAGIIGAIFKTEDGGENWYKFAEETFLLMDPQNSSHLYKRDSDTIYESTNQGKSWETVYTSKESCPGEILGWAIHPTDGNTLFVGGGEVCEPGIYLSNDSGRTWTLLAKREIRPGGYTIHDMGLDNLTIGLDKQGGFYIRFGSGYSGSEMGVKHNEYGGWKTILELHDNDTHATFDSTDLVYFYCESNLCKFNLDKKQRVTLGKPDVGTFTSILVSSHDPNTIYVTGEGMSVSRDGGLTWTKLNNGLGNAGLRLEAGREDKDTLYVLAGDCLETGHDRLQPLYISTNSGSTWDSAFETGCHLLLDTNGSTLYRYGGDVGGLSIAWIWRSPDGGKSWEKVWTPDRIITLTTDQNQSGLVYIYARGDYYHQYFSEDYGHNWRAKDPPADVKICYGSTLQFIDAFRPMAIDPFDGNHVFVIDNGILLESHDSCDTTGFFATTPNTSMNSIVFDPNNLNTIYAGTDGGAYISYDSGATWGQVNDGLLGAVVVYSIVVDKDSNVYAATPYGVFKLEKK